jgi:hypothetical protein
VGYVGQDARLFYGSLRENIMIGKPEATAEELLRVLRLTGLDTEENQARSLLNDLETWMATQDDYAPDDPLGASPEVLAHRWVRDVFRPAVRAVPLELRRGIDPPQLYHELLEHRWFLSEQAQGDVGMEAAAEDYIRTVLPQRPTTPQA